MGSPNWRGDYSHVWETYEETYLRYALVETHPPIMQKLTRWEGGWITDDDDFFNDIAVIQVVKVWLQ